VGAVRDLMARGVSADARLARWREEHLVWGASARVPRRADAFVGNPRSAVTEFVDMVRHSRNQQSRPKMEL
jgi:hypothetical protein